MTARLSDESLSAALDAGHNSLSWQPPKPSGFLGGINFNEVLASPEATAIIQAMPVQPLYYAIKQRGLADSLDILPHLSMEQFTHILDYDGWERDELVRHKAFEWFKAYGQISPEQLYQRFADLEEEYQLALLTGRFKVYTEEEVEKMGPGAQDNLFAMPCNTVFYDIVSDSPDEIEFLHSLVQATCEHNLQYAYALISYPAFVPPGDSEFQLKQFRKARLEEDGFVPFRDSVEIFWPIDLSALEKKWHRPAASGLVEAPEGDFFDRVLLAAAEGGWDIDEQYRIHQGLLYLANGVCTVSQVEPDDIQGLNRLLEQVRALVGLGLDYLSQGNIERALEILKVETPKALFQVGLSLIHRLRKQVLARLEQVFPAQGEVLRKHYQNLRPGALMLKLDRQFRDLLGIEMTEALKGLFNRYPMRPEQLVQTSGKVERLTFEPISSIASLREFAHYMNGISAWLYLATRAGVPTDKDLEKALTTTLVRALTAGSFVYQPLQRQDLALFEALSDEETKTLMDKLQIELSTELLGNRDEWAFEGDFATPSRGIEYALYFMKDYVLGLMLAKKSLPGDISHLVITAEGKEQSHDHTQH